MDNMAENKIMYCPYCDSSGYDLIGLKSHLLNDCTIFSTTENVVMMFGKSESRPLTPAHLSGIANDLTAHFMYNRDNIKIDELSAILKNHGVV